MSTTKQTLTRDAAAESYTFGIEIECTMPTNARPVRMAGGYHHGREIGGDFPAGWTAERDTSIHTSRAGYRPVEIVSPVLHGREGLEQARAVAQLINDLGGRVNPTCGLHVHIGVASVAGTDFDTAADWVRRMITQATHYEEALYGVTGTRRRENGHYAGSSRATYNGHKDDLKKKMNGDDLNDLRTNTSRYSLLNIQNVFSAKHTVEFRCFAGTVEPIKIVAYIQMCLALASKARRQAARFEGSKSLGNAYGTASQGKASKALNHFFYATGWTPGRKDRKHETMILDGYIGELEELPTLKAELRRLTRKYDAS